MTNQIKHFKLQPLVNAKFISTSFATYEQDGIEKSWEIVEAHDSVAILIYHKEKKSFVLVKQFRPAVYLNNDNGMTVELCAGIVDKKLSLAEIAKEEIEALTKSQDLYRDAALLDGCTEYQAQLVALGKDPYADFPPPLG